jgi:molybdate transport system ATP-binding protein
MKLRLKHHFPDFTLDLDLAAGSGITALFGRSGAGKSTVMNAVAGLLRPDEGHLEVDGETLMDTARNIHTPPHKRRFGTVFQDAQLFPHLTVAQNLDFGTRYAPRGSTIPRDDVIDLLGIRPLLTRAPTTLSGGEKQRVALGRALLCAPRMLLMDEPLASLDATRKHEILPYLEALRDGPLNLPILYVSHSVDEITRLADTLVLLKDGHIAAQGPLRAVMSDPAAVPLIGVREAGSVIEATVQSHDDDGLTTLSLRAGQIVLPSVQAAVGTKLRLRIKAQDVMIARTKPHDISALNILTASVMGIHEGTGPGVAVTLDVGGEHILARITRRAVGTLDLRVGTSCFAVLKSTTIAPNSVGR